MAIKKSQIYSTLWSACDALRGSMDASQYKDYVLILLFVKYLSDKEDDEDSMFTIPEGCRFSDFVALKGKDNIGESINKKLEAIKSENAMFLRKLSLPNFNDPNKLGSPKQMTDTLSKLVAVFEDSNLDFSRNRSADDDILGDAYEYLMKNFAAESGKSKGQFYTPAEVSRAMAMMLNLGEFTSPLTTIYDPACGSGSLLLKAINETPNGATPYGQEKDNATATLAILNMLLHGIELATIEQGDTLNDPRFLAGETLETFDVCVANPPFSTKNWLGDAGIDDLYHRWNENLCPPAKCGDFAFLLHLIASMRPDTGRGACILPHGVLFRGNAEYTIRKHIVDCGYIEGIIGLPPNIFFGTGIPAGIIMINKAGASDRKGIFFIDAKDGFMKDGPKNRLREQDVKRIVDTWNARKDVAHYARFVPMEEIRESNDYNLNIPRYITPVDTEVQQDIEAHLHGGIPAHDLDNLDAYWLGCPALRDALFTPISARPGYYTLAVDKNEVTSSIEKNESFIGQSDHFKASIEAWVNTVRPVMMNLTTGIKPKILIEEWSQLLLNQMLADKSLVNAYDVYQRLMEYWAETLQDDCYMISRDAWKLQLNSTKKNATYLEMICDLLPVSIVIQEFFSAEESAIKVLQSNSEMKAAEMQDLINKAIEDIPEEDEDEIKAITADTKKSAAYKKIKKEKDGLDKQAKEKMAQLTKDVVAKYESLTEEEIKSLVVDKKWLHDITADIENVMRQVTLSLSAEVVTLAERYETTLSEYSSEVSELEDKVLSHLKEMGFEL